MKKRTQVILSVLVILALAVSFAGCSMRPSGDSRPAPAPEAAAPAQNAAAPADTARGAVYENGGLKLTVPAEYAPLVQVDTAGEALFSVTEIASLEAAKKNHADSTDGMGWLFSLTRIGAGELHEQLGTDMSGRRVIGRSGEDYYLLNTPTDVRIEREGEITPADMEQWSALYTWINGDMVAGFLADNGLTACSYSNTTLDMLLARIAWGGCTDYTMASLDRGTLAPRGTEGASFAEELLNAGNFIWCEPDQTPDGEYYVLNNTAEGIQYDFFRGGSGEYVRESGDGWENLYRSGSGADLRGIVERWMAEMSSAAPAVQAPMDYDAAVNAVLAEYAALDQAALENYNETLHPELPWYTAVIANPVRNNLYYGYYDFDTNGVPELVIAAGDDSWQQPMAIYAYDGAKMVYLCKEQALGERATVSYVDGTFVVRASGGAATGSVTVYAIGPDGYTTWILASADYEFDAGGNVTLTPTEGEMSKEELNYYMSQAGTFVNVEYTRFASMGGGMTGMANPWSDAATIADAARGAGLESFTLPEVLTCFAGAAPAPSFRYMDGLAEAVYTDGTNTLVLRKGMGTEDVSGDYNTYPETREIVWKGLTITCAGENGMTRKAAWFVGENAFSLTFTAPLADSDVTSIVNQIQ